MSDAIRKPTKLTIAQINRQVKHAAKRAKNAAMLAEKAAADRNAQIISTGVRSSAPVSSRMSSKGFAEKDPHHMLKILKLMNVDAMQAYKFIELGLTSYKYHVSTLTNTLVDASIYPTLNAAAMTATMAIRYLFEMAMAMEVHDDDAPIRELLCWHSAQQLLQGRASRGVGIVAANTDAKALLATALVACVRRVEVRVKAAEDYKMEMSAMATASGA